MKIACETSGATTLGTYMIFDARTWQPNCPLEDLINRQKIVSVDFEWQMDHFGENHFISLIQIAFKVGIAQVCVIIRTHMSRSLPKAIIDLFMNENCIKIIASPLDYSAPDFMKLWHSFELDCIHNGFVSLQHLARERGYPIGIEKLANCFDLPYESCADHLKWADNELEPDLIRYAADDAFLNLMIYDKLLNIEIITKRLNLFWEPSICYPSYTFATDYAINTISPHKSPSSEQSLGASLRQKTFGTMTPQKSPEKLSSNKSLDVLSPTNSEINCFLPTAQINRSKFAKISPISPPRSNFEKSYVKSNYPCKYLVKTGKCNKIKCEYSHSLIKCEICDITCTSSEAWDRHIKGRKHLISKRSNQGVQNLILRCKICELNFDSAFQSRYHFKTCKDTKIKNLKVYKGVCREKKQSKSFHL